MKTYQLLWRIVRYQPWVFLLSALYTAIFFVSRVIFGYIIQTFFNILPTSRQLSPMLWEVIALLVTTAVARYLLTLGGGIVRSLCFLKCSKTCLQHCRTCFTADRFTLERARAFRSTGEFVSR